MKGKLSIDHIFWALLGLTITVLIVGIFATLSDKSGVLSLFSLVLAGVLIIVFVFIALTTVLSVQGLSSHEHALGLPQGSVRAILAILLTTIFVGVAVFLIIQLDGQIIVEGLKKEPKNLGEKFLVVPIGDPPKTWNIIALEPTEAVEELAKQIFTTVATVLVMVIGFYFGNKAAAGSTSSAAEEPAAARAVSEAESAGKAYKKAASAVTKIAGIIQRIKDAGAKKPAQGERLKKIVAKYEVSMTKAQRSAKKCQAEAETCRTLAEKITLEKDPAVTLKLLNDVVTARKAAVAAGKATAKALEQVEENYAKLKPALN